MYTQESVNTQSKDGPRQYSANCLRTEPTDWALSTDVLLLGSKFGNDQTQPHIQKTLQKLAAIHKGDELKLPYFGNKSQEKENHKLKLTDLTWVMTWVL